MSTGNFFKKLVDQELLVPYLEQSILNENWPDEYTISVNSAPYYGKGDGLFHPSTHALMSVRQLVLYLRHGSQPEAPSLAREMAFAVGSALHAIIQTHLVMANMITEDQVEVRTHHKDLGATGSMDWVIDHPNGKRFVCDLKTCNPRVYRALDGPKDSWVYQLQCYMDWFGVDEGIILVMETAYPHAMREFRIKRDEKILNTIYSKWRAARQHFEDGTIPETCCQDDPSYDSNKCPFRKVCAKEFVVARNPSWKVSQQEKKVRELEGVSDD